MKKIGLGKRISALLLSALMAVTLVPSSVTYADTYNTSNNTGGGIKIEYSANAGINPVADTYTTSTTIKVGETATLLYDDYKSTRNYSYSWSIGDSTIVSGSSSSYSMDVTGLKAGTTTVTETVKRNRQTQATIIHTVIVKENKAESVTISGNSAIAVGRSTQLAAAISPSGAAGTVKWSSGDTAILTIDDNGIVTAVSAGTATVTATVYDTDGTAVLCTASMKVSVEPIGAVITGTSEIVPGETATLTYALTPAGTTVEDELTATWQSSDTAILTVADNGSVTGIAAGTATVTLTLTNPDGTFYVQPPRTLQLRMFVLI